LGGKKAREEVELVGSVGEDIVVRK